MYMYIQPSSVIVKDEGTPVFLECRIYSMLKESFEWACSSNAGDVAFEYVDK